MTARTKICGVLAAAIFAIATSTASAATVKTIYSFCSLTNCEDGALPQTLIKDSAGHIYGMAAFGGSAAGYNGQGTAFELVPKAHGKWSLGRLYVFCANGNCSDGSLPQAGLIVDGSGNLYGTTASGGTGHGNVFELISENQGGAWSFENLYSFSGPDGDNPSSQLSYAGATATSYYDGTSPLFGSTLNGGKVDGGGGTIFQLTPTGNNWALTTLHDFSNDGWDCESAGGLFVTSSSTVYGVTSHCGSGNVGYVYALSQANEQWNESVLYSFDVIGGDDTYYPWGPLYGASSGSLYGAATWGGPHCAYHHHQHGYFRCGGDIFELTPNGGAWSEAPVHIFCSDKPCDDGERPTGGLVRARSGAFYGTTVNGGANGKGVAFKIASDGKYSVIYNFCSEANCADGANPSGPLLPEPHGHFYGATSAGGANNWGTVFELTP